MHVRKTSNQSAIKNFLDPTFVMYLNSQQAIHIPFLNSRRINIVNIANRIKDIIKPMVQGFFQPNLLVTGMDNVYAKTSKPPRNSMNVSGDLVRKIK